MKSNVRGIGMFNAETENFNTVDYMSTNIDWAYMIPEDGELVYQDKDTTVTKAVKKHDIVLQMYYREYNKHQFIVIRSKEWKENIKAGMEYAEKQAAEWKAKNEALCEDTACSSCCGKCEGC